jgi:hypothetical protein
VNIEKRYGSIAGTHREERREILAGDLSKKASENREEREVKYSSNANREKSTISRY